MKGENILSRIGYAATLGEESIFTAIEFAKNNEFSAIEINLNVPAFFQRSMISSKEGKLRK
ncbi:hypothetical protein [Clostridium aceticum]|uniref:hypothetical protein n=1 Tax=Clostridium aceticum TaxID=84022 RepID=UPI000B0CC712|nr:hypothetical protein [Clostridium aceticum]